MHMMTGGAFEMVPSGPGGSPLGGFGLQVSNAQRMNFLKQDLTRHKIALDERTKQIFKETVDGLKEIKKMINDQYGEINILRHGRSCNGVMSSTARPDFVAMVDGKKIPVMVEVKNAAVASPMKDRFQAEFYNTVGAKYGITVLEEQLDLSSVLVAPPTMCRTISETILIYPRLGKFEISKNRIGINEKMVRDIWTAKQLGIQGMAPETDCDSSCPHRRNKKVLPEENIEVAPPLPLVYAKGRTEQGANLDAAYWSRFLRNNGIAHEAGQFERNCLLVSSEIRTIEDIVERRDELNNLEETKRDFFKAVSRMTGLGRSRLSSFTSWSDNAISYEKLEKEMAGEIDKWKKMLGAKKFKNSKDHAKGQGTVVYSLPRNSAHFVERSWDEWN